MSYLGIGVTKNNVLEESAIYRFKQCLMWGDISSFFFLKYIYELKGQEKEVKLFDDLIKLVPYLEDGRTVLPEDKQKEISEDALELFNIISSIKQDIVINLEKIYIDYSFVEVMISPEVHYLNKLGYINNYSNQEWKEATNSSHRRIGMK